MAAVIRVLYVDDEPALLELCKMFLEESGEFFVETIESASAALVLLNKEPFDAIVSDYLMPGLDGIQFLAEVRAHMGKIPFILFTGKGREEIVIKAIENGADFYLQKGGHPTAQFAELVQKIRAAVERRTSENALKESEVRFRTMIDWTHDWEYWIGPNREFIYVSPSVEHITGYTPGEFTADPELIQRIVHPDDRARWEEHTSLHSAAGQTDDSSKVEFRIIHRNGSLRWIGHTCRAIFTTDGTWAGRRITNQDITGRKVAEESLLENRLQLATAMDLARIVNWEFEVGTGEFTFDDRFYALYGTTAEREGGYRMSAETYAREFVPPDEIPGVGDEIRNLLETTDPLYRGQMEHRIIRRDGEIRTIIARYAPVMGADGHVIKTFGANQDITERKRVEEQLLIKNYVFESSLTGNSIADNQGLLTSVNPAFLRLWGYNTKEEVIGKSIGRFFADEKDAVRVLEALGTSGRWEGEFTALRADGSTFFTYSVATMIRDDAGKQIGYQSSVLDITERKQAEAKLRDSLAEKDVLLKEIHHRVKNNLQIVSGLMYLQSKLAKDPQTKEILSACRNRITSMALLHENLFQVSNFSSVSMSPYINNLVKYLADSYDTAKFLTFEVDIPVDINLDIDTGIAIGMIVTELATNSIKYAFAPGEAGTLEVALHPSGEGMLLTVRDNGKGLPKGYDLTSGPGLGMKLVTNLVSQVHGTFDVTSGQGTAINITFTSGIVTGKGPVHGSH